MYYIEVNVYCRPFIEIYIFVHVLSGKNLRESGKIQGNVREFNSTKSVATLRDRIPKGIILVCL